MGIWLVMRATDGNERTFLVEKPCTVIGRETTCDVRIPVPSVSQKHCQIMLDGGELQISDLNSDHGTFHNGNRVQQARLVADDTVTIGPVTFRVRVAHESDADKGLVPETVIVRTEASARSPHEGDAAFAG